MIRIPNEVCPFVFSIHHRCMSNRQLAKVNTLLSNFHVDREVGGFTRYTMEEGDSKTTIILLPRQSFKYSSSGFRTDIMWLWAKISGMKGFIPVGENGCYYSLFSTNMRFYSVKEYCKPSSWDEEILLWKWIEYICSLPIWRQKRGKERQAIENLQTRQAIELISIELAKVKHGIK